MDTFHFYFDFHCCTFASGPFDHGLEAFRAMVPEELGSCFPGEVELIVSVVTRKHPPFKVHSFAFMF